MVDRPWSTSMWLQQLLPFTVLKLLLFTFFIFILSFFALLQQLLPFTVLKRYDGYSYRIKSFPVATALTVYGIETPLFLLIYIFFF